MTASDSDDLKARIAEVRKELREFEKPRREKLVRLGRVKPRTAAEWEIFASDLLNPVPPTPRQQRKGGPRRNTKRAVITDVGMDPGDVEGETP